VFADGTLLDQNHHVNAYMINAIGAYPFGGDERFQPYLSGGVGSVEFRGDMFEAGFDSPKSREHFARFGANVGAGVMTFAGHWGVRGDVRYFRAQTDDAFTSQSEAEALAKSLLSQLAFWRANVGVALRW
jgi:opacity protein-like surface antigen